MQSTQDADDNMKTNNNGGMNTRVQVYIMSKSGVYGVQWNLAIPATLGTNKSGWISEVAGFTGYILMYKRMD